LPQRRRLLAPAVFVLCSLGVHVGIYALLTRPPKPLASVGTVAMVLDIVLGADVAAGTEKNSAEVDAMTTASIAKEPAAEPDPAVTVEPKTAAPVEAEAAEPASTTEPEQSEPAIQAEALDPAPRPEPVLEAATRQDAAEPTPRLDQPKPQDSARARPERVQRPVERPAPIASRKPTSESGPRRQSEPEGRSASVASTASSGIGRGRSDAESNCPGLAGAHLARFKQFPADAQARGDHGVATVAFGIDAGGRVTSVRLSRGSGVGSIDQEAQAMVRRASPFPLPADCRAMSFSVPLSFDLLR
jgi:protein TonB